jgi:hypothetical protein
MRRWWPDLAIVAALSIVAIALRYYKIGEVPPGFNSDEAVGAVGALETLRSGVHLHYAGQGGGGALGFYIAALAFALFGPSVATIRGTAAFAGVVSVIATYFLVREMFRRDTAVPRDHVRLLAALAALGLATSGWHVQSSRVAFAAVGVPFLQAPAAFCLWRGLNTRRRRYFVLSGVLLAGGSFIYLSGAFVPIVFLAFFVLQWAGTHLPGRSEGVAPLAVHPQQRQRRALFDGSLLAEHFHNLLLCAGVAAVFLLPMVYFLVSTPEAATQRAQQTLFTNPLINQGDPWGTLWRSLWGNLAAFGLSTSWLQGQPPTNLIMPPALTLLFLVGLAVSLWHARRPPYLFTVLSWAIMIVPSILSPDSIPHQARALGASVAAFTLIAVGMLAVVGLVRWLISSGVRLVSRSAAPVSMPQIVQVGVTAVVLLGIWLGMIPMFYASYRYYFTEWPATNDAQAAFHVYAVDLASEMSKETDPQAVFILPRDTAAGDVNPNYTVMFLYTGQAGYAWAVDDERTLEVTLNQAVAGRDVVHVVHWKTSKHTGADPKEIIRYYLEKHGHPAGTHTFEYFDIDTYRLDQTGPTLQDTPLTPAALDFGNTLTITGFAYGDASGDGPIEEASVPAGSLMWARLRVRLAPATQENLKLSLTIRDPAGHTVGQIDKLLVNNILHRPTSTWAPGTETDVYFLVPVEPASAPGDYSVAVSVYNSASQSRLMLQGTDSAARRAELGVLAVRPDLAPPRAEDLALSQVLDHRVAEGLTLLGYAGPDTLRPGERASLALVWQAYAPLAENYQASVWASQDDGLPLSVPRPLAGLDYPTDHWAVGQIVRGWFDLRLPPDMPNGAHTLGVRVTGERGQFAANIALGSLQVAGWSRRFDLPQAQFAVRANFSDRFELLGYDLLPPSPAVINPEITLYWRAASAMDVGYTTFVHVLDAAGQVVAQVDHVPGDGAFPTTGWLPGEVIADRFVVPLPADRIADAHEIEVGAYDPATLQRLSVLGADGRTLDTRLLLPLTQAADPVEKPPSQDGEPSP